VVTRAVLLRDSPQSAITVGITMLYLHIENIECSAAKAHTHGAAFPDVYSTGPSQHRVSASVPYYGNAGVPDAPMRRDLTMAANAPATACLIRSAGGAHLHVGAGGVLDRLEPAVARVPRRHLAPAVL
jgi:hypothetical protein